MELKANKSYLVGSDPRLSFVFRFAGTAPGSTISYHLSEARSPVVTRF
jgi:hypothetical protein